ncbi:MAG: M36 family metallopeptidase [Bryobacteraceae bacterium]|nr:M36 family metallopeptidase [Bryobacteraceae bacterium]
MRFSISLLFFTASLSFAQNSTSPRASAEAALRSAGAELELAAEDLAGVYVAKEYRSEHNGVTHFVFRQRFDDVDVFGTAYTVNVDREGRVLNSGGELVRKPKSAAPSLESGMRAIRTAIRAVNPALDGSYLAAPPAAGGKLTRFARGGMADETEGRPVWFADSGKAYPAWLFYIRSEGGLETFATVVDANTQRLLFKNSLTRRFQAAAEPAPQGLVFERGSPQPNSTPGVRNPDRPYVERTLQPLTGDPAASPKGWVDGDQTVGNNVVAGANTTADFQTLFPRPATAPDRNFSFPLEIGPGAPSLTRYTDAATVNLFYWANIAHDKFWQYGFNEAAGNYQQDNFGRGGVGGDPMLAYSHFGVAAPRQAETDNAFYVSNRYYEDGARSSINMFIWAFNESRVFSDGSLDAEIIIHEYAHGVSSRLVEGVNDTHQSASMGEGWSDYFGLEFALPMGLDANGFYPLGEYAFQNFGLGIRTRPYTTDMQVNPLTFANLTRVGAFGPEVHDDGEIWFEALWEGRAALITQLGEREGRRRMAQLVLDGLKLSVPRPSMVDARDAILLADRVNNNGASQMQLWTAFAKRGLGVVAHSENGNSAAVTASFEAGSNTGTLRLEWDSYNFGDQVRVLLHDGNLKTPSVGVTLTASSGDQESLILRRRGDTYYGILRLGSDGYSAKNDTYLDVVPGDYVSAYYVDAETESGPKLIETTAPVYQNYSLSLQQAPLFIAGRETAIFSTSFGPAISPAPVRVVLPFPFRFYDKTYRTIYVYPNGYINLGSMGSYIDFPCNTTQRATQVPTIAPLWMEMAYGGFGQRSEGVFYSTTPGAVTIRWAAETVATGEPINASVILYDDGRIVFQYGSANYDLTNSNQLGCEATTPLVGISSGKGTFARTVDLYLGTASLEGYPDVVFDPPFNYSSFPSVRLESPVAGGKYAGVVTVKGVSWDVNDYISRLDVLIDGVPRRLIQPGISRLDFCNSERVRGCPNIGFETTVDLTAERLTPGDHTIQILATNSRGAFRRFPDEPVTITVEVGQSRVPVGRIESPVSGATIAGNAPVRGYVYAQDLRIVAVDVLLDGTTYGVASYGQRRDDICGSLNPVPRNCPGIGFSFTLISANGLLLPNGPHTLQVRAHDESGRTTLIPETPVTIDINNAPSALPRGVVLNPAPNSTVSGTVKIWGWGWDPDGTIRSAQLTVDGRPVQTLSYGDPRPEQCAAMPDVKACPNIGFWGDFDTSTITNGLHQFGVRLTDNTSNVTEWPKLTAYGMNVTVAN